MTGIDTVPMIPLTCDIPTAEERKEAGSVPNDQKLQYLIDN